MQATDPALTVQAVRYALPTARGG
eukprot:COSAG01_NODE_30227_length_620_cov_1.051823_1_plen_23_part_10